MSGFLSVCLFVCLSLSVFNLLSTFCFIIIFFHFPLSLLKWEHFYYCTYPIILYHYLYHYQTRCIPPFVLSLKTTPKMWSTSLCILLLGNLWTLAAWGMICGDGWWRVVMCGDVWWRMVMCGDVWWCVVMCGDVWWCKKIYQVYFCFSSKFGKVN